MFKHIFPFRYIAFALKRIGKLYPWQQHFVIVRNNHSAEQGLPLLILDLSKKDLVEDAHKVKGKLINLSQ
ncbi:hypothetical protein A4N84_13725 [Salmonella enterica subsp. enterica serovar Newport]|nr:hypothetical protein [Salmonella enterica subsp. enterica serovar Amager]EAV1018972.1 hypothetical protein [Salmonella enterica]EDA3533272.1 hypothetical protein [Salmonella enterica subsp. enterica serovar Newport]EAW7881441.1 hypothetical protein [Salmonella enterica]EAX9169787.1 hypothetical protein [Salmonella enterica]